VVVWASKTPPSTWKENCLANKITSIARKPINGNPALPKAEWKILLVGDYPSNQKVRAAILEQQGYVVDTVRDAEGPQSLAAKPLRFGAGGRRKESMGGSQVLPRNWQGSEFSAASGPFGRVPRSCDYGFRRHLDSER